MSESLDRASGRRRLALILLLVGEVLLGVNVLVDRDASALLTLLVVSVVALPLALVLRHQRVEQ